MIKQYFTYGLKNDSNDQQFKMKHLIRQMRKYKVLQMSKTIKFKLTKIQLSNEQNNSSNDQKNSSNEKKQLK